MSKKLIYGALGALTIAGSLGLTALNFKPTSAVTVTHAEETTELTHALVDETVYVFTNANGEVKKTISSDWTKNSLGLDEYKKTEGKQETPVSLKVTYTLNDEPIEANDLAGKSGKVTIKFVYTNNEKVNGYFVPYAVMTGLTLDNDHFKNISVENGKILNDGNKTAIAGVALPGLRENLGISKNTFNIPSDMTITADVTDFKLGMTMSLVTNEIFKDVETDHLDSLEGLESSLNKLTNGMNQLISGSSALYDGLSQLNSKTGALVSGVKELSTGATKLQAGANQLADGLTTAESVANQLSSGLDKLTANNSQLTSGASQLKAGVFTLATAVLKSINPAAPTLTESNYTTILSDTAIAALPAAQQTQLKQIRTLLSGAVSLSSGVSSYTSGVSSAASGAKGLATGLTDAKSGANTLAAGVTSLNNGLASLNAQTPALADGVSKLTNGSKDLKDGINTFNEQGIKKLVDKAGSLENLAHRLKTTLNLGKTKASNTKYIFRTDEIK